MITTRTLTLGQDWFVERSKNIIHNIKPTDDEFVSGSCNGIAYMALIMYFSGDIDLQEFNEYMEWIHDTPETDVPIMIENAKSQQAIYLKNPKPFHKVDSIISSTETERERLLKLLNIYILFQNIHVLQNPRDHAEIFSPKEKVISQQCELDIISLLLPIKLEKLGGVDKIATFSGCYNKQELLDYFKSFQDALIKQTKPVMFILSSVMHAIALVYNPEKREWIIVDANRLLAKKMRSEEEITEAVLLSFFDSNKAIFATKIYSLKNNSLLLTGNIQKWMKTSIWESIHAVTPEKANTLDILGDSWLSIAAKVGCLDTVIELLKQPNVDPNIIGRYSTTPLKMATEEGNFEIVKAISHYLNTDINLANERSGVTPLNEAAHLGNVDIVKLLLAAPNVDINKSSKLGVSPLMMAAQGGYLEIVVSLLRKQEINVNQSDNMGGTALYLAAQNGHLDVLKELLKHPKIDVNVSLKNGSSPLYIASFMNHPEIVKELIKSNNINLNTPIEKYNETALYIATAKGYLSVVKELLKHPSVDVNCFDCYGYTPLHIAIEYGFEDIVQALLQHPQINVNLCTKKGDTPLFIARAKGYKGIEKLLINSQNSDISFNNCKATMYGSLPSPSVDINTNSTKKSLKL